MPRARTITEQSIASYPGTRHNYDNEGETRHPLMRGVSNPPEGTSVSQAGSPTGPDSANNGSLLMQHLKGKLDPNDDQGNDIETASQGSAASGERAAWGGQMEFLFTCIGYAVGLGNVWRFPYLCYKNGGGAFLLPYVLMLAFVGLPLFYLELCLGQFASLGPISVWKINPLLKGLGMAMVAVSWLIAVYYNVIISHVMLYLFASFASVTSQLPWVGCDNSWNTPACLEHEYDKPEGNRSLGNDSLLFTSTTVLPNTTTTAAITAVRTPAEEYYDHFILEISDGIEYGGGLNWKLALCLLLSWLIVLICLIRGIQSLGKVVYFTAIFPYIMLTILLVRGLTLPGASDGIIYYLKPDFSRLADPRVWSDATTQIFYSLSACSGGLIAMSSYNRFNNNCYRDSLIVSLINCGTSLYAGFVIFSILGFMAHEKGVSVADVAQGGPGLAFVVYPEALSRMAAPQLWAILFFFMMATLGFGSQFSIVECVLSAITDEFHSVLKDRWASIIFRTCVIMFTYFMGLPMVARGGIYLLDLVDYSVSGFPLLVVGFLESLALAWIYGYDRLSEDIKLMLGKKPTLFFKYCWMGITPAIIFITIIFNVIFYKPPSYGDDYSYPGWAQFLGWLIALFPISLIVIVFLWRFCRGGGFKLTKELSKPTPEWGPYHREDRTGIYDTDLTQQPLEYVDWSGRLYSPQTFMLARTPAGSTFNVANVKNYTGPIPVVLSMAGDKQKLLTPSNSQRGIERQISQSMSDLETSVGSRSERTRVASGSAPHIPVDAHKLSQVSINEQPNSPPSTSIQQFSVTPLPVSSGVRTSGGGGANNYDVTKELRASKASLHGSSESQV